MFFISVHIKIYIKIHIYMFFVRLSHCSSVCVQLQYMENMLSTRWFFFLLYLLFKECGTIVHHLITACLEQQLHKGKYKKTIMEWKKNLTLISSKMSGECAFELVYNDQKTSSYRHISKLYQRIRKCCTTTIYICFVLLAHHTYKL